MHLDQTVPRMALEDCPEAAVAVQEAVRPEMAAAMTVDFAGVV